MRMIVCLYCMMKLLDLSFIFNISNKYINIKTNIPYLLFIGEAAKFSAYRATNHRGYSTDTCYTELFLVLQTY